MRPPICTICNESFAANGKAGGLVSFALTEEDKKANEVFKQPGFVGHPRGLEWFCGDHIDTAKQNRHLTWKDARLNFK